MPGHPLRKAPYIGCASSFVRAVREGMGLFAVCKCGIDKSQMRHLRCANRAFAHGVCRVSGGDGFGCVTPQTRDAPQRGGSQLYGDWSGLGGRGCIYAFHFADFFFYSFSIFYIRATAVGIGMGRFVYLVRIEHFYT